MAVVLMTVVLLPYKSVAQKLDTLLQVSVINPHVSNDTLEFSLGLTRLSNIWERWANATFELVVDPAPSQDIMKIALIDGTTQLNNGYTITPRIVTSALVPGSKITQTRISITILGPEFFSQANSVGIDTSNPLLVGRFRVIRTDGQPFQEPISVNWLGDYTYYQATAYKIDKDNTPWNMTDDNIEMASKSKYVSGRTTLLPPITFDCSSLYIKYLGSRVVQLSWETQSERLLKGFVVVRGLLPFGETDTSKVEFSDTLASFHTNPAMRAKAGKGKGAQYMLIDTAELRGEYYFYKVIAYDTSEHESLFCMKGVNVPFAVISAAAPQPNPFSEKTTVEYVLDDDVYLTCKVYNAAGQLFETLINNKFSKLGTYTVDFVADAFALQGMYDIIFIATPIKDQSIELSRAVVKVQLLRH